MSLRDQYPALVVEARGFSQLPDDWDGEGARKPGIASIGHTLNLLEQMTAELPELPEPDLAPCANGSIDLWWKQPSFTLLMNVHEGKFSWYGVSGDFNTKGNSNVTVADFGFIRELALRAGEEAKIVSRC